jgi:hypothetical protein
VAEKGEIRISGGAASNKAMAREIGYAHLRKLGGPLVRQAFDHQLPRSLFHSVQN